jgi:peptidoglycan/LPS O-acetylase OafA/YrhL
MKHVPALDGLRGIAILLVLWFHAAQLGRLAQIRQPSGAMELVRWLSECGWSGVDLFVVLSGYLITGILLRSKGKPHYFRNFYMRRALRLCPLFFAALAVRMFLMPLFGWPSVPTEESAAAAAYGMNIYMAAVGHWDESLGVSWSLSLEEQFYVGFSLLVFALRPKALAAVCVGLIAGAIAFRFAALSQGWQWAAYVLLPARMDGFAVGALIAIAGNRLAPFAWPALIGSLGVLAWIVAKVQWASPFGGPMALCGYTAFDVLYGSILLLALNGWGKRLLESGALRAFGKYSYALYLFHFPIMLSVSAHLPNSEPLERTASVFALSVPLTFGLAWLSWHLFEKRFLELKRHF